MEKLTEVEIALPAARCRSMVAILLRVVLSQHNAYVDKMTRKMKSPVDFPLSRTRIFFSSDLHGADICFRKFVNAIKYNLYSADVAIANGDLTGKAIIPFVRNPDNKVEVYSRRFWGQNLILSSDEQVREFFQRARSFGYYPQVMTPEEYAELQADPKKLERAFKARMLESLSVWVELAEERLRGSNVRFFMMAGNDDPIEAEQILSKSTFVVNPEHKVCELPAGHQMIGLGYSNPTPWNTPREYPEDTLYQEIEGLASGVSDMRTALFNLHCPPYDSVIDVAPTLDKELRPKARVGGLQTAPVGSTAVRKSIEKFQPLVGLHGHVHESPGEFKIGRTICFNPGSEYQSGILRGYVIDIDGARVVGSTRIEG